MYFVKPLLLLSLVVSTASCAAEGSTEPFASPTVSSNHLAGTAVARPISGTCALTADAVPPFPFTPPLFEPIIHLEIAGVCNLRHLGRTTFSGIEQVNLVTGVTNTATWTAANGDQLMSEFIGTGSFDGVDAIFGGEVTFVGGTGRFEGATGTMDLNGTSHFTSGVSAVGEYRMSGTITY